MTSILISGPVTPEDTGFSVSSERMLESGSGEAMSIQNEIGKVLVRKSKLTVTDLRLDYSMFRYAKWRSASLEIRE